MRVEKAPYSIEFMWTSSMRIERRMGETRTGAQLDQFYKYSDRPKWITKKRQIDDIQPFWFMYIVPIPEDSCRMMTDNVLEW